MLLHSLRHIDRRRKDKIKMFDIIQKNHRWRISFHSDIFLFPFAIISGIFTCEVSDFDDKQYGSVKVEVRHYPQVDLDPMSASIMQGTQVSIKCISPDDSWQQFSYEWFKVSVIQMDQVIQL